MGLEEILKKQAEEGLEERSPTRPRKSRGSQDKLTESWLARPRTKAKEAAHAAGQG